MVNQDYLHYPHRRAGLDHELFHVRRLKHAPGLRWGNGKSLALNITVGVDHYPMDMTGKPFMPVGGLTRPYPDIWNYCTRDYGNRVGLYRVMRVLSELGLKATAYVNSAVGERYPVLLKDLVASGWEIAAAGIDMGQLHHGGLALETEREMVRQSVGTLRGFVGDALKGWHSPAYSESLNTPALVAEAGLTYIADWVNDDMPYRMTTSSGSLVSLPLAYELSDKRILFEQNQSLASFEHQVLASYRVLKGESAPDRARVLSLSLSPWVIGQPYRIKALRRVLTTITQDADVFCATGSELVAALAPQL
ncbi:MAG: polysaccharide deacetylase family protein [Pseudomonadota bacterium]